MKYGMILLLTACLGLWGAGCGAALSDAFVSPAANVQLARRHYEVVRHGLSARACAVRVLGFGVGDLSYAKAVAALNEQAIASGVSGEYQLINVVASRNVEFYLLGWKTCTVVEADVAVLLEPVYEPGSLKRNREDLRKVEAVRPQASLRKTPSRGEQKDLPVEVGPPVVAPAILQRQCEAGSSEDCLALGKAHATGQGMVEDPSLARQRFVEACNTGSAQGCYEAATLWATGQGSPPDATRARELYDKGCQLSHALCCAELATMVKEGRGGVADPPKAERLARKACRLGHVAACPAR